MKRLFSYLIVGVLLFGCSSVGERTPARNSGGTLMDVHGAGAQRSDPKSGDPADYPDGHGPQGDVVRVYNHVRAVRLTSSIGYSYPIVDTGQMSDFTAIFGEDADYTGLIPEYTDNGDGTVADNNTGLVWQKDTRNKIGRSELSTALTSIQGLGGYTDWRLPTIKELYSLILFSGRDVSSEMMNSNPDTSSFVPFIDGVFDFEYGDTQNGERIIDVQFLSSTEYVSTTMNGAETVFGVNFADGRIKGYPYTQGGSEKLFNVIFVRGNPRYGHNFFFDNGDGTITDTATGLMWTQDDGGGVDWQEALEWAEGLETAGYTDWRLPNAKELQTLVDYTRSPDTSGSAAIDPLFSVTAIRDEGGNSNYPFYWTSTTHVNNAGNGDWGVYIAFGEALGYMSSSRNGRKSAAFSSERRPPPPR